MKRNLYLVFSVILLLAALLSSCKNNPETTVQNTQTSEVTPAASLDAISQEPIVFVFLQSESSEFSSLYHQLAYIQMESAGYNVSNIYINEDTDLSYVYDSLAEDNIKYAVITSPKLEEQTKNYVLSSASSVTFIQNSDNIINGIYSYRIKLYEYYYLCGAALGEASETMTAGFVADSPDEQTVRCINAFALGMKSVNENAKVVVSWVDANAQKNDIIQIEQNLLEQNCDVLAYFTQTVAPESSAEELGIYHMTMSTHKMLTDYNYLLIKPGINLMNYFGNIINSGSSSSDYSFTYAGIKTLVVSYELSNGASDNVKASVSAAYQNIQSGYEVFSGPLYNDIGLVVPEGISLPEEDILDMLWFVDNVAGEVPAG